jgi:hypothetical protein
MFKLHLTDKLQILFAQCFIQGHIFGSNKVNKTNFCINHGEINYNFYSRSHLYATLYAGLYLVQFQFREHSRTRLVGALNVITLDQTYANDFYI